MVIHEIIIWLLLIERFFIFPTIVVKSSDLLLDFYNKLCSLKSSLKNGQSCLAIILFIFAGHIRFRVNLI